MTAVLTVTDASNNPLASVPLFHEDGGASVHEHLVTDASGQVTLSSAGGGVVYNETGQPTLPLAGYQTDVRRHLLPTGQSAYTFVLPT